MQPDKVSNYWLSISPSVSVALLTVSSLSRYISPVSHSCLCHHSCHFSVLLLSRRQSFSYPFLSLLHLHAKATAENVRVLPSFAAKHKHFRVGLLLWQTVKPCFSSIWSENWIWIRKQDKLLQNASKSARSGKFVILDDTHISTGGDKVHNTKLELSMALWVSVLLLFANLNAGSSLKMSACFTFIHL